jgi:tRNA dimethylallyltransferase
VSVERRIVVVAGATATGKTMLGEALADALGGAVVCADARQVFAELDAGTGKPTRSEREARPHYLFDALTLGERANAGRWAKLARDCCEGLLARGVTPVLVGGSGLYLSALIRGLHAEPPHDAGLRAALLARLAAEGPEALHARLAQVDPVTAARLAPRDRQRIVRALEVCEASGRTLADWHGVTPREALAADWRVLELTCDAAELDHRIATRTRAMFDSGLVEETAALVAQGRGDELAALHAIGYDEAMDLIAGRLDRETAEARTNRRTRQLGKRQRTWFRHQLDAVRLEAGQGAAGDLLARALRAQAGGHGPGAGAVRGDGPRG